MPPKMPHVYGIYPHGMYDKKKKKKVIGTHPFLYPTCVSLQHDLKDTEIHSRVDTWAKCEVGYEKGCVHSITKTKKKRRGKGKKKKKLWLNKLSLCNNI